MSEDRCGGVREAHNNYDEAAHCQLRIGHPGDHKQMTPWHESWAADPRPVSPESAPPRATTPPMTDERLAAIRRDREQGHPIMRGDANALLDEVDRLRSPLAGSPPTTPEPRTEPTTERAQWEAKPCVACGLSYEAGDHFGSGESATHFWQPDATSFELQEIQRLRAALAEPSPESGALVAEMDARIREIDDRLQLHRTTDCPMTGEEECCDTLVIELRNLRRYRAVLSTLERDAARMREAALKVLVMYDNGGKEWVSDADFERLRRALSPSGEPE